MLEPGPLPVAPMLDSVSKGEYARKHCEEPTGLTSNNNNNLYNHIHHHHHHQLHAHSLYVNGVNATTTNTNTNNNAITDIRGPTTTNANSNNNNNNSIGIGNTTMSTLPSMDINHLLSAVDQDLQQQQQQQSVQQQGGDGSKHGGDTTNPERHLNVVLEDRELWEKFKEFTNEMIVTKNGR